jgi:hypothetical protein
MAFCYQLGNNCCHYLKNYHRLEYVDISHCPEVSIEAVASLSSKGVEVIDEEIRVY